MKGIKRIEMRLGLLLFAVHAILWSFTEVHEFFLGLMVGGAMFLIIVGLLPQKTYDNLLYRRLLKQIKQ